MTLCGKTGRPMTCYAQPVEILVLGRRSAGVYLAGYNLVCGFWTRRTKTDQLDDFVQEKKRRITLIGYMGSHIKLFFGLEYPQKELQKCG